MSTSQAHEHINNVCVKWWTCLITNCNQQR